MKYIPEIKTIKKINFSEDWIELTFQEGNFQSEIEKNQERQWHYCCKSYEIYNKIKDNSKLSKRIHNKGFKGLKMAFYYNDIKDTVYSKWEFLCFVYE